MNILKNKEVINSLNKQTDLFNTINGGVAHTKVDIKERENSIDIALSAPSVSGEAFKVVLNYNQLTVFSVIDEKYFPGHEAFKVPMFLQTFHIPSYVDFENIEAINRGNEVEIILPLVASRKKLNRLIQVKTL
jgi:HSP20 family protein